ncbi:uncharacterized protein GIQ15_02346 [Arthroderma uncinatum]|uniref:uncharacterized protein n=1 Tax=Arthroderma uncinatum TaxID=74035 RepID=UPI00144AF1BF|nr:uncharacterized protein GIQ15_02346 [Arthroderma uncinatum]KAF3483022.1 hypothetical protein GIQ15_02346 [Arthroderma uncinatum]
MSLPPERICIKRRREDEPVETLYIQSDIHQPKRRFTDYVFQRVVLHDPKAGKGDTSSGDSTSGTPAKGLVNGNRAVSVHSTRALTSGNAISSSGIPIISTPSTRGDGVKTKQQRPKTPDREEHDATDHESARSDSPSLATLSHVPRVISPTKRSLAAATGGPSVRRFHLEAPVSADDLEDTLNVLHRVGGGIQKKRLRKSSGYRPVIVEKVASKKALGKTSALSKESATELLNETGEATCTGRQNNAAKRLAVNEEQDGRENKESYEFSSQISKGGRKGESIFEDPSTWDHESDDLANELARIALEMTNDIEPSNRSAQASAAAQIRPTPQKRPLKYKPRLPKAPRAAAHQDIIHDENPVRLDSSSAGPDADAMDPVLTGADTNKAQDTPISEAQEQPIASEMDEDSDSGYVFDEFVRRPVHDVVADPSVEYFRDGKWIEGHEVPKDVGVVVITQDDSHFWDTIAEDEDEKDWDTEDEDSNAEDNPATEYPDEDLDFDDEYDDNNAIYRRFRVNASDDEEYDAVEYDQYGYRAYNSNMPDDSESDD